VATTTREPELTPIKFSRLTRRGVLLGLSGPQLVMASLASGTLIIGLYIGAVVMTLPIILFFAALAFVGIGGRKFLLFTRGEHAWTKSEDADQALINAMKRGSEMTVRPWSNSR
jgi:hypothetical protein